ncbi:MAG: hypothetical protein ACF8PN_01925 [Phycisphaerales bacterium]
MAGGSFYMLEQDALVDAIRVTRKPNAVIDTSGILNDEPDFFVRFVTGAGERELQVYEDQPIGNGLEWKLEPRPWHSEIREVSIWDEDMMRDDQLDRAAVDAWIVDGQRYRFEFVRLPSPIRPWVIGGIVFFGFYSVVAVGLFLRDHAI